MGSFGMFPHICHPQHPEDLFPYDRVLGLKGISPSLAIFFLGILSLPDTVFLKDGVSLNEIAIECYIVCGRVLRIQLQDQICSCLGPHGERDGIVVIHTRQMFINQLPSAVRFRVQNPVCEDRRGYLIPLMGLHTPLLVLEQHHIGLVHGCGITGTASVLKVLHCERGQLQVILSCPQDVGLGVTFAPTIYGTNRFNLPIVKADKVR